MLLLLSNEEYFVDTPPPNVVLTVFATSSCFLLMDTSILPELIKRVICTKSNIVGEEVEF